MSLPPLVKLSVPHIRFDCYRNLLLLPFKLVCFAWIVTSSVSNIYTRYTALFSKCLTFGNLVTRRARIRRSISWYTAWYGSSFWPTIAIWCTLHKRDATVQKAMRGELRSTRALRCSPHTVVGLLVNCHQVALMAIKGGGAVHSDFVRGNGLLRCGQWALKRNDW